MNKQFLNYIRSLSKSDKKTLSQKALKTAEEVGELAKVVLPFDNAYATNHRFVEREKILEEAADTILCALSIAYELDFTDDELDDMLLKKAEKWAMLQAKEQDVKYPLPYEIHVTVQLAEGDQLDVDCFKRACENIGVKPIVIDLQTTNGTSVMHDVMTSSKHFGNNSSAYSEAVRIAAALVKRNYNVVRTKVETVPWHPAAPKFYGEPMPPNCYFESHLAVTLPDEQEMERLRTYNRNLALGLHISQNVFKRMENGEFVVMCTYRSYNGESTSFNILVDLKKRYLEDGEFKVGKPITEFAVYDTKISHDASWITK